MLYYVSSIFQDPKNLWPAQAAERTIDALAKKLHNKTKFESQNDLLPFGTDGTIAIEISTIIELITNLTVLLYKL